MVLLVPLFVAREIRSFSVCFSFIHSEKREMNSAIFIFIIIISLSNPLMHTVVLVLVLVHSKQIAKK